MENFKKKELVLRQTLIGKGFYNALIALEFAKKRHTGTRKDGVTPEFDHQISIALFALTLPSIQYPEELIATIMLHDVREDYGVSHEEVLGLFTENAFASRVAIAVDRMTKEFRGVRRDEHKLFAEMALDPVTSIAKLCDRVHNLQSMVGVFTVEKQKKYIQEVNEFFFPMLKLAKRNFPHQTMAYENIKWMLKSQIQLIEAVIASMEKK